MDSPEVKERKKKARKKWRESNWEKEMADQRKRRQKDPEKAREMVRKWRADNPEKTTVSVDNLYLIGYVR